MSSTYYWCDRAHFVKLNQISAASLSSSLCVCVDSTSCQSLCALAAGSGSDVGDYGLPFFPAYCSLYDLGDM